MADIVTDVLKHVVDTRPILDESDKLQRIRRIQDAYDDVQWLKGVYSMAQDADIHVRLNTASMALAAALEVAKERV
jgi:hypothetical protein